MVTAAFLWCKFYINLFKQAVLIEDKIRWQHIKLLLSVHSPHPTPHPKPTDKCQQATTQGKASLTL